MLSSKSKSKPNKGWFGNGGRLHLGCIALELRSLKDLHAWGCKDHSYRRSLDGALQFDLIKFNRCMAQTYREACEDTGHAP